MRKAKMVFFIDIIRGVQTKNYGKVLRLFCNLSQADYSGIRLLALPFQGFA